MVLLVGATGRLGSRIARELLASRTPVRALCRPTSASGALRRMGAEIVVGDMSDAESLGRACSGIDTLLTTASAVRRGGDDTIERVDLEGTRALFEAAARQHVRHIVYVSAYGADDASATPLMAAKGQNEAFLRASGVDWTVVAPDLFMESSVGEVVGRPAAAGQPVTIVGDGRTRHAFIAEHDVAAFSVAAVKHPAALNRRLEVGGQVLAWHEVVATYERTLGRTLEVRYADAGTPIGGVSPDVRLMLEAMDRHDSDVDAGPLAAELGVPLTSLDAWVRASVVMSRRGV